MSATILYALARERERTRVLEAEAERLRDLLRRWLETSAAMGGGPVAELTQDTLDAIAPRQGQDA